MHPEIAAVKAVENSESEMLKNAPALEGQEGNHQQQQGKVSFDEEAVCTAHNRPIYPDSGSQK